MKITFLTPGTGTYYCGACMRDNALAKALHEAGHEVSLLPMYLPLQLDEEMLSGSVEVPVFFGGINVYLQQKSAVFRHTPKWVDDLLDRPGLLRRVAERSHMTSARDHGEMTLAMLRLEESRLGKEMGKLIGWLEAERPDVLCLSTALQVGMIRELKQRLGVKVICCFQGEDSFLDGLPEPWRERCWRELALRVREADAVVSPSAFYAGLMRDRLGMDGLEIEVMPNGVDVEVYRPATGPSDGLPGVPDGAPVIGFLARMIREKGFELVVDAFIHLRTALGDARTRLHLAGAVAGDDEKLVESMRSRLAAAGLADAVEWSVNIPRDEKVRFLQSLTLFSVPAIYHEAFGMYLVEALACGLPVVQPEAASFREIVGGSGAGRLVAPNDPVALAEAWRELLRRPGELAAMGEMGRRAAEREYSVGSMRDRFVDIAGRLSNA